MISSEPQRDEEQPVTAEPVSKLRAVSIGREKDSSTPPEEIEEKRKLRHYLVHIGLSVAVLLTGVVVAWLIMINGPKMTPQMTDRKPPAVKVVTVLPQTVRLDVRSQGTVLPRTEIALVSEVSGKVVKVNPAFSTGGFFKRDELLVMIDPSEYDLAITKAKARVAEAKQELVREEAEGQQARSEWQALGGGNTPSALALRMPQLQEKRAKFASAEAELIEARLKRQRCELHAPFDGGVREKRVDVGQYVTGGEVLSRLYSSDVAEVRLPLRSDQLEDLDLPLPYRNNKQRHADPSVVLTAHFGGKTYRWVGQVVRIESVLDGKTSMFYAIAQVQDPYGYQEGQPPLAIGLFVEAEITGVEQPGVFVLPLEALHPANEVWAIDGEMQLHRREVGVLRVERDRVLVSSGLKPGDRVMVSALETPVEGMRVSIDRAPP